MNKPTKIHEYNYMKLMCTLDYIQMTNLLNKQQHKSQSHPWDPYIWWTFFKDGGGGVRVKYIECRLNYSYNCQLKEHDKLQYLLSLNTW